jgi:hypothetical protein
MRWRRHRAAHHRTAGLALRSSEGQSVRLICVCLERRHGVLAPGPGAAYAPARPARARRGTGRGKASESDARSSGDSHRAATPTPNRPFIACLTGHAHGS